MKFVDFRNKLAEKFEKMTKNQTHLFEVEVDKDEMWNLYLDSFLPQYNRMFRERREMDCSCCRQFVKNIGNVVVIKDNKVSTIWDFTTDSDEYDPVLKAMSNYIQSKAVTNVYIGKEKKIGTLRNFEQTDEKVIEWNHLFLELEDRFIDKSSRSIGDLKGSLRDIRNVFKRSLDELSQESILTVLDLVRSETLYKGAEWKTQLELFLQHKKAYDKLSEAEKANYTWEQSVKVGVVVGKIRNHSIGQLLINVSEGMDLDTAVKKYEVIVAPSNYKRSKPIYTQKMLEDAKKTIQGLGYMESLTRRHAKLDDITVNNILFSNKDSAKRIGGAMDIFDEMSKEVSVDPKKFSKVEEISYDKFVENILPSAKEVEVLLENKHSSNMVSLIAPEHKDAKTMFKWDNNFSWAYSGNITDSSTRENVKKQGGLVDADVRVSMQWNEPEYRDENDYDLHMIEPSGYEIDFGNRGSFSPMRGMLDVDITQPSRQSKMEDKTAVENITYKNISTMKDGTYQVFVHNYSHNGGTNGFMIEVEILGELHVFQYRHNVPQSKKVQIADLVVKDGKITVVGKLPSSSSIVTKNIWGLKSNQFVPVSTVMYSPNFWDEQEGVGHKHVFFMLKDCVNTEMPNAFYNEFLNNELYPAHRKVMEALGTKMHVGEVEDQLSGIGFSTTKRNEVIVKVVGVTERVYKVKF